MKSEIWVWLGMWFITFWVIVWFIIPGIREILNA
jgi:hypothetical protein